MTIYEKLKVKIGTVKGYEDDQFKQDITYTLADVLLALAQKSEYYGIRADGHWLDEFHEKTVWVNGEIPVKWNLKDDNLDHQSNECKEFLIKLLL